VAAAVVVSNPGAVEGEDVEMAEEGARAVARDVIVRVVVITGAEG